MLDEVQEQILSIYKHNLGPQGVGYVSYTTYPGWRMRGMLRDMMMYHTAQFSEAQAKVQQARARFGCRFVNGRRLVPSDYVMRDRLIRLAPGHLDQALQRWSAVHGEHDDSLPSMAKRCATPSILRGIRPTS